MAGAPKTRRAFSAEFKIEALRRMAERRAAGVSLKQIGREWTCATTCCGSGSARRRSAPGRRRPTCSPGKGGCRRTRPR